MNAGENPIFHSSNLYIDKNWSLWYCKGWLCVDICINNIHVKKDRDSCDLYTTFYVSDSNYKTKSMYTIYDS